MSAALAVDCPICGEPAGLLCVYTLSTRDHEANEQRAEPHTARQANGLRAIKDQRSPSLEEMMRLPNGSVIVDLADDQDSVWRVDHDGLTAIGGGAVDWDWRAIALNGGPSDTLRVVC